MNTLCFEDWGVISYRTAWERQQELFDRALHAKQTGNPVTNHWIFCEHLPVITLGKSGHPENLLLERDKLVEMGVDYVEIDRGGDITYHAPGQVVAYPVIDLENFGIGLRKYIELLEEIVIRVCGHYGVTVQRSPGASGVWVGADTLNARKICAIGVRSSRFVTMHGFAFNITTDLSGFRWINPCGFKNKGVTSLQVETGSRPDIEEVRRLLKQEAIALFETL